MQFVAMINASEDVGISCLLTKAPILSIVSGSMNCKHPVRDKGILPVAEENINNGIMDTPPASHIGRLVWGSWFGQTN